MLHVGEYIKGGVGTYLREVLQYQSQRSDITDLFVILSNKSKDFDLSIDNSKIFYYSFERYPQYVFLASFQIYSLIKKINPDIIHVHSTFAGVLVRILFLIYKKRPIIYCPHGWSFLMHTTKFKKRVFALIERTLSIPTDLIINISNDEYLKSTQLGIDAKKSRVVYNGISETIHVSQDKVFVVDDSKINLLFVGRFDHQKGLDILARIAQSYPLDHIKFYLIGSQVLENKDYILDLPDSFVTLGWVDNSIIDEYYSQVDAVIIPSRWEGFGLVALEAMKNKKAVLASNVGGLKEIVEHNETGLLFNINDEEAIVHLLNNLKKEDLQTMGLKGYNSFKEHFTSEKMNNNIFRLYKELLEK
ncbi:glycosyltransferase family 1 protein [Paenibacillus thalictri]|uniref:Glycosyltransferase family 1 protein n=1 Tax=Paenibacillus thalictri TaxID=2527873 RepID=A0A4Q9DFP5_9BACL|nr:glycosyltransferase family 1 protein [Paenibacillus thalictri]